MPFEERDFFKEALSRKELDGIIGKRPTLEFFSSKSPSVKKMGLNIDALSEAQMKRLMIEEPRLLRRPLLKVGGKVLVGFKADEWDAAFRK